MRSRAKLNQMAVSLAARSLNSICAKLHTPPSRMREITHYLWPVSNAYRAFVVGCCFARMRLRGHSSHIELLVPGFVEYRRANLFRRRAPLRRVARQFKPFNHFRSAIQRHLAKGRRVEPSPIRPWSSIVK